MHVVKRNIPSASTQYSLVISNVRYVFQTFILLITSAKAPQSDDSRGRVAVAGRLDGIIQWLGAVAGCANAPPMYDAFRQ